MNEMNGNYGNNAIELSPIIILKYIHNIIVVCSFIINTK